LLQPVSCFLHLFGLEFSNWDFLYPTLTCDLILDWQLEARKSDIVQGSHKLVTASCRSRRWMASCCNHFRVFLISLAFSSQSDILLCFSVAGDVSFDWHLEARKSNIVRGSYKLFTAGYRSRRCMASCCNHFRILFTSVALSSQSGIFLYFSVVCEVSFHWQLEARKSDTVQGSYELFTARCCSRQWMASCYNHFRVFFISMALSSPTAFFYILL
jgi:hypothetical protein